MQIVGNNRAVLLRLKNPERVTTIIPKSKKVGAHEVLVHWGVDEARVLNNLGIACPSPINHQYNWPGRFTPFVHQIATSEFLTANRRALCLNEQGCVDSETEYLSPTGWVPIKDYVGGQVAQYHPETGAAEFVEPEEYVKLPCEDMVRIKTNYGLDQLLSPEHRVLIEDGKSTAQKLETVHAVDLMVRHDAYHAGVRASVGGTRKGTDTIAFSSATVPTTFVGAVDSSMGMSDAELRVVVAAIADGHYPSATNHCVIRLKKERKKERLRALLQAADIPYEEVVTVPEGFVRFTFTAPRRYKSFGSEFWTADTHQRKVIAEEALLWDGCTTRGERFSTTVKESADFIQYAFASTGLATARINTNARPNKTTEYVVQVRRGTRRLYTRGPKETITYAPSTDGYKYCFVVPSTYLVFRRNGCIFLSGNTGKTNSAIWAADYLLTKKTINRVLVIAPLSTLDTVWRSELFATAMHRTCDVAHGSPKKRKAIINGGAQFVIMNYAGVELEVDTLAKGGFDCIIVDEATHYKNPQTKRWKALDKLVKPETWLWMMTGTPAVQSPMDAYGLAKLVNPAAVPRNKGSFQDMLMYKVSRFRWVPKPDATETLHRVLQPAIRFTKEECLDLPDRLYSKREVELTRQQGKYYKELVAKMKTEAAGARVTAQNAAIAINKLLQISSGAVYTDEGDTLQFDVSARYNVLRDTIDEASHKTLVFVPFKHAIEVIRDKLTTDGYHTEVIHGGVSATERARIFTEFKDPEGPQVLVMQPQAVAHGVTLTEANTVVWWGPVSSTETYLQANDRIHRAGQTNKCYVIQLFGSNVEKRLYAMLDKRIDAHEDLVSLYKEILD